ncbi:MAG TPA: cyclic nucleotide-binding domain-containing protein [Gammaproteobacteria bacterium]|jgi:CRP-like cAMP-binding protein|nr:cyclic nucleotide-binding domain-containing protein [Gammaproteobacteria bacterium]
MIRVEYLQSHALFGGVANTDLEAIIPLLKEERYATGDDVVREGDEGSCMYFIRRGSVEVLKNAGDANRKRRLAVLNEGDTFGEMELIDVQNRSASVRALEELTVLTLGNEDMYEIFEHNRDAFIIILMNIAREISRRLRKMDALVASSLYAQSEATDA